MKHFVAFLFFAIALVGSSNAQLLAINQPLFGDRPFFNTQFIQQNQIKSIKGSISSKKVQDIIRSNNLDYLFRFNEDGTLQSQLSTHYSEGAKDTTVVFYTYKDGKISVQRKSDGKGYYSYVYQYDDNDNIITRTYYRDENSLGSKKDFQLKKQYIIVKDSFSYQVVDRQAKKIFYNSLGKKYKVQTSRYDSLGYLVEVYTKFIIGNRKEKTIYEYDEIGRIYKKHVYTDIAHNKKNTTLFGYDEVGNVLDLKHYQEGTHTSIQQFLYDKNMLLNAMIVQDVPTGFLQIIKYRYTFYDDSMGANEVDSLKVE